jgi:hypothetical protein
VTCVIDISVLQFGQISIDGTTGHASIDGTTGHAKLALMTLSFPPDKMSGRAKGSPGLGACQSEKLELELARSLCDSGSITKYCAPIIHKSREKSYDCRRMGD